MPNDFRNNGKRKKIVDTTIHNTLSLEPRFFRLQQADNSVE